ncbi:hypothetical protein K227x_64220 [Rubripirellula lacrimiformis]|uniref:Uncharacterized protein n=1 Tax=Rubripirellula lacrimiformis TaxID=1930273 RepID=A0A517NLI8_9BACT|nr:hypothetical protein [Rubripirellula lacrimiformis]QDT07992.1 hypothetical protein K227x_64220 [Rubripirellula lacrimiformis]
MNFLYFVEHPDNHFGPAEVAEAGIDYAIDGPILQIPAREGNSPSGKHGWIVADKSTTKSIKYDPQNQTWVRRVGDDRVWIGYAKDRPPKLAALRRSNLLHGQDITLADGSRIHVPIARQWSDVAERLLWSVALPQTLGRNESGEWVPKDVIVRYRRLWNLLCGYIDASETAVRTADVEPGAPVYFNYPEINELAIAAITANYRVSADEVEICGVYDQTVRSAIIATLKDDATKEAWIKKKAATLAAGLIADGGTSCDGADPSTQDAKTVTPQH